MILTISVNRDSHGMDPWMVAVLPPAMLTGLRDRPTYSVAIMTLTDGVLDSQEFRIIVDGCDSSFDWMLLSGRLATADFNNGVYRGVEHSEDLAVSAGVQLAVQLATS